MLYVIHRDGKPWHGANKRTNNVRAYESEATARRSMNAAITSKATDAIWREGGSHSDTARLAELRETEAARWQIVEYAPITKEESA